MRLVACVVCSFEFFVCLVLQVDENSPRRDRIREKSRDRSKERGDFQKKRPISEERDHKRRKEEYSDEERRERRRHVKGYESPENIRERSRKGGLPENESRRPFVERKKVHVYYGRSDKSIKGYCFCKQARQVL